MMYRQGDVLLVRSSRLPRDAKRLPHRVIAEGEAGGHRHSMAGDQTVLWLSQAGGLFVEVQGDGDTLEHAEHGPITVPGPAIYRVVRQREYKRRSMLAAMD